MQMNIEIGRGAKPLDEGHRAGVGLGMGQASSPYRTKTSTLESSAIENPLHAT